MPSKTVLVVSKSHFVSQQLYTCMEKLLHLVSYPPRIETIIKNTMDHLETKRTKDGESVPYNQTTPLGRTIVTVYPISSQDNTETTDAEYPGWIKFYHPETNALIWAPSAMAAQALSATAIVWNCDALDPDKLVDGDFDTTLEGAKRIVHEMNHTVNGVVPFDPDATVQEYHLKHELRAWTVENSLDYWLGSEWAEKQTDPDVVEKKAFAPLNRRVALANNILPNYPALKDLYDGNPKIQERILALCSKSTSWGGLVYTLPGEKVAVTPYPGVLDNG
jgi:hypothetical protein